MRVAIVGSRTLSIDDFYDYLPDNTTEVISGGAGGIDTCARVYCTLNGIKITEIFPNYKRYGRGAPIIRNREIINVADFVLVFWDGNSKGTKSVIDECIKLDKDHKVYIKRITENQ